MLFLDISGTTSPRCGPCLAMLDNDLSLPELVTACRLLTCRQQALQGSGGLIDAAAVVAAVAQLLLLFIYLLLLYYIIINYYPLYS